jgi:hypothetical protein
MEFVWFVFIFLLILIPYGIADHREKEKQRRFEIKSQRTYGASPWSPTGTYSRVSENLDFTTGSAWFEPPEPLAEPVSEPDISYSEPDISYSEPLSEPDRSKSEPDMSNHVFATSGSDIVKFGNFSDLVIPVDLLGNPSLDSIVKFVLLLRSFKEGNKTLNHVSAELGIKKGGSKQYRLLQYVWEIL